MSTLEMMLQMLAAATPGGVEARKQEDANGQIFKALYVDVLSDAECEQAGIARGSYRIFAVCVTKDGPPRHSFAVQPKGWRLEAPPREGDLFRWVERQDVEMFEGLFRVVRSHAEPVTPRARTFVSEAHPAADDQPARYVLQYGKNALSVYPKRVVGQVQVGDYVAWLGSENTLVLISRKPIREQTYV